MYMDKPEFLSMYWGWVVVEMDYFLVKINTPSVCETDLETPEMRKDG